MGGKAQLFASQEPCGAARSRPGASTLVRPAPTRPPAPAVQFSAAKTGADEAWVASAQAKHTAVRGNTDSSQCELVDAESSTSTAPSTPSTPTSARGSPICSTASFASTLSPNSPGAAALTRVPPQARRGRPIRKNMTAFRSSCRPSLSPSPPLSWRRVGLLDRAASPALPPAWTRRRQHCEPTCATPAQSETIAANLTVDGQDVGQHGTFPASRCSRPSSTGRCPPRRRPYAGKSMHLGDTTSELRLHSPCRELSASAVFASQGTQSRAKYIS